MATIENAKLTVSTDRLLNQPTVAVNCDVEFTEFEVNAMNMLDLRHQLSCNVLNKDLWFEDTVIAFDDVDLPRAASEATAHEHVVFETVAVMSDIHGHMFTRDQLIAELSWRTERRAPNRTFGPHPSAST